MDREILAASAHSVIARFLTQHGERWAKDAAVKGAELPLQSLLEPEKPDFVEHLLPFREHPAYQDLDDETKRRILTCGWLIYNERIVRVETDIVSVACNDAIAGRLPGARTGAARESMAQALVDEAYHTLLVVRACRVTREQRGLTDLEIPLVSVVRRMHEYQAACDEPWKRDLVQLMSGVAVEMSISRYLSLLSTATDIQAFNRVVTALHRQDESMHVALFAELAREVFTALDSRKRDYVREVLPMPWLWFAEGELDIWRSVLRQIGFARGEAMMNDCVAEKSMKAGPRALADAQRFADSLGIDGVAWDRAAVMAERASRGDGK
jgi:hypothetical protein